MASEEGKIDILRELLMDVFAEKLEEESTQQDEQEEVPEEKVLQVLQDGDDTGYPPSEAELAEMQKRFFEQLHASGIKSIERPLDDYFYKPGEAPPMSEEELAAWEADFMANYQSICEEIDEEEETFATLSEEFFATRGEEPPILDYANNGTNSTPKLCP